MYFVLFFTTISAIHELLSLAFNDREDKDKGKQIDFLIQISSHNFCVNTSSLKTIVPFIRYIKRTNKKPFIFDVFLLIQRTFYCATRSSGLKSVLGVFLIKTIMKARLARASRVDSEKCKQKIIGCSVGKFNYNRLALANIASKNLGTFMESRTEF